MDDEEAGADRAAPEEPGRSKELEVGRLDPTLVLHNTQRLIARP